jgi:hypothetical protein
MTAICNRSAAPPSCTPLNDVPDRPLPSRALGHQLRMRACASPCPSTALALRTSGQRVSRPDPAPQRARTAPRTLPHPACHAPRNRHGQRCDLTRALTSPSERRCLQDRGVGLQGRLGTSAPFEVLRGATVFVVVRYAMACGRCHLRPSTITVTAPRSSPDRVPDRPHPRSRNRADQSI